MSPLADSVLALIRTRSDLHRWSAANAHGGRMLEAVDILESAIPTTDPAEVYSVTHRALASAVKVIARADDSSGIIGDACRRLLELHPVAAAAAGTPPKKLVDWMITFQFDGVVDYFEIDPVAYAPALGETGMSLYRARLDEVRDRPGPEAPPEQRVLAPDRHERWVLEWNDKRLAVLDRDVDAIIRTHARDRRVAAWYEDTARAFAEIGEINLAIAWAGEALDVGPLHQSLKAARYWCELLKANRPDELLPARLLVFRRWPSETTASQLHHEAQDSWSQYKEEVLATLASSPYDAVGFALRTLQDVPMAWDLAHSLDLTDYRTWSDLIKAYEKIDPHAVLPVHRRLVEADLVQASADNYRIAARRLVRMRTLAAGSDREVEVDAFVADLRETNRRRPRLRQEFDKAGLP